MGKELNNQDFPGAPLPGELQRTLDTWGSLGLTSDKNVISGPPDAMLGGKPSVNSSLSCGAVASVDECVKFSKSLQAQVNLCDVSQQC